MGDAYADIPRTGGDFAKAVAVCINSRVCESDEHRGVMCPSFRATGNRHYSTGGRVRLLKAALNGEFGDTALADPTLAEAMDACVACKGCKRECEGEVDMAAIKTEYLAQLNSRFGVPWRAKLFAHLPTLLHRWPWLGRLIVWRNRTPWAAKLGERLLGISAEIALPEPASAPGSTVATGRAPDGSLDAGREIVLFGDTFSRRFEPGLLDAASTVLHAAGFRVLGADPGGRTRPLCCGRTYLAQGMIEEARAEAARTLAALLPYAAAGRPIIGLEPSCLLAMRDDWKLLGLGQSVADLAPHLLLFEEFLAREQVLKPSSLRVPTRAVLVHGHCHQKAAGAMKSMRKVLRSVPGLQFEFIEAACCGMAGSFGAEAEHVELSRAMAEQALLPALRARPDAEIVSNGFSCRHQMRVRASRRTMHLAQWLSDHLV